MLLQLLLVVSCRQLASGLSQRSGGEHPKTGLFSEASPWDKIWAISSPASPLPAAGTLERVLSKPWLLELARDAVLGTCSFIRANPLKASLRQERLAAILGNVLLSDL
jgi:hypothetical protein